MTDTSDTYIAKVLRASPFAEQRRRYPANVRWGSSARFRRNGTRLKLEIQGLHEDAAGADI